MPTPLPELVVLLVDDNADYLKVAETNLKLAFEDVYDTAPLVLTAPDGPTALSVIAARAATDRPVRVLVTDADMPGMTGPALIRQTGLRAILYTGRPKEEFKDEVATLFPQPVFFTKPQTFDEYLPVVREVRDLAASAIYPDLLPNRLPVAPPVTAVVPPTVPPAPSPRLASRHLAIAQHPGAVLAVRIELGPITSPAQIDAEAFAFGHVQRHFAAFRPAVEGEGGEVVALVGLLMVAVFADGDALRRACRAMADYRTRMTTALPTLLPTFAGGVCEGAFQTGVFGDQLVGRTAAVGANLDVAMQLATQTTTGHLGWVKGWLSAASENVVTSVFPGPPNELPATLTGVSGPLLRLEVKVV